MVQENRPWHGNCGTHRDGSLSPISTFENISRKAYHLVVDITWKRRELVEQCKARCPNLVNTKIKGPEMDGIDAVVQIYRDRPVPVILVSAYHDPELLRVRNRTTSWGISSNQLNRPTSKGSFSHRPRVDLIHEEAE
jgi:chemotaxis response regulator CheB